MYFFVKVNDDKYNLSLNREEALTLYSILSKIGGDEDETYRKYTTELYYALDDEFDEVWDDLTNRFTKYLNACSLPVQTKKLTVEQISDLLGYEVKVVK